MNLTEHFTREEIEHSEYAARHGIDNRIPEADLDNWRIGCDVILETIRRHIGKPVIVTSGYRNDEVNEGVGGSPNSQHRGRYFPSATSPRVASCAFDIHVPEMPQAALFAFCRGLLDGGALLADQLIDEFGSWVHVSFVLDQQPRGEVWRFRHFGDATVREQLS